MRYFSRSSSVVPRMKTVPPAVYFTRRKRCGPNVPPGCLRRSFLSALLPGATSTTASVHWLLMNASNRAAGLPLDPEHRVQATGRMGVEHLEGPVAAVVDHDIVFRQNFQMRQCRFALVAVRVEVEVDRQLEPQLVQTTDQALR